MQKEDAQEALQLIRQIVGKVHDDTILQQWGVVMIAVAILNVIALFLTQYFILQKNFSPWPYITIWSLYLGIKLLINLWSRRQMGGTMTYVEKHIWGNGITYVLASFGILMLDLMTLPLDLALKVIPAHQAIISAVSFAIISLINTRFFLNTAIFFLTAALVGIWPTYGYAILGIMWFFGLLIPGILFYRERKRTLSEKQYAQTT
ncbi:MAG TPA: hypothetical protein DCE42_13250 [Myxococcales bacterium]|nr:hypothetical protein [Deltaproteobacteria bacterium]MBU48144.1 hypothetical protein [Deltaproteobacteria bacterium]HAA55723.1 hypothetical protein [Myxococcales bacterium]|tara:strand:+ start:21286 stop:21900 length:615 start_codon:yes stop_codon:yes gene_type:complete